MDTREFVAELFGPEVFQRIPRVCAALNRRGTCGLGEVKVIKGMGFPVLRITLPTPAQSVAQISVSCASDYRGELFAETALIAVGGGLMYTDRLGYKDGIRKFSTEDSFFAELERLSGLLAN